MAFDIDPNDLIIPRNYGGGGQPHDVWTQLREHAPVHRVETDEYENFWALTRHADIMDISTKPEIFSNRVGPAMMTREQVADFSKIQG